MKKKEKSNGQREEWKTDYLVFSESTTSPSSYVERARVKLIIRSLA